MGRKGRRPCSSGGAQAFQLAQEERAPLKLMRSIASGMWAVLVQSQRRQRFLMTMMRGVGKRGEGEGGLVRLCDAIKVICCCWKGTNAEGFGGESLGLVSGLLKQS